MPFKKLSINGSSVQEFQIVYPAENSIAEFLAEELSKKILAATGFRPAVVSDASSEGDHELRLGATCRTTLETTAPNTYRIAVSGQHVEALTNCAFGYDDILTAFDNALSQEGDLAWADGTQWQGTLANTPLIPESYDVCILYHNILGYLPWYPVCNRAKMGLELYREYMPDVIGLQEVSHFYHNDSIETIRAMEEMGYQEIRFPRYGYGNPIYYNANRLMLLECGYKTARPGDKGTTWSVFEIKRSGGKTFAVMNSHFAADSNANRDPVLGNQYRAEDAKILVQVVEMTKQRYPGIPIFTGGDYNSDIHSDPLKAALDGGLICIRDVAKDHTCPISAPTTAIRNTTRKPIGTAMRNSTTDLPIATSTSSWSPAIRPT